MKTCNKCQIEKPLDYYYRHDSSRDGHRSECKDCTNKRSGEWARRNPEKRRGSRRKWRDKNPGYIANYHERKVAELGLDPSMSIYRADRRRLQHYGVTLEDFERMFKEQGGVCIICKRPERRTYLGKVRALCVEHDHKTMQVRGLACADCNTSIALMGEEPMRLRAAADYLERHAAKNLTDSAAA